MFTRITLLGLLALLYGPVVVLSQLAGSSKGVSVTNLLGDGTVVNTTNVGLSLICGSENGPTEWVHDYDEANITAAKLPCTRVEYNGRWFEGVGTQNTSFLLFSCKNLDMGLTLGCRSVQNHSDNVLVTVQPNLLTGRLDITKQRGAFVEYEYEDPKSEQGSRPCVRFAIAKAGDQNYWQCVGPDGAKRGKVIFHYCNSALYCANTHRRLKLVPLCVDTFDNLSQQQLLADKSWLMMEKDKIQKFPAGTVVCKLDNDGEITGAAVEFFFAGSDKSTFHFSRSEISMNDLIWFEPAPPPTHYTLYAKDEFESVCKVSHYGFGWFPRISVRRNGSQVHTGRGVSGLTQFETFSNGGFTFAGNVSLDFGGEGYGPGVYEVECGALVWNTSEWASQAITIKVLAVVAPHFDANNEHVMVRQGDANARLRCDAHGDPAPIITWSHGNVPGLRAEGPELVVTTSTHLSAQWINGIIVSCTAVNKFGQRATKIFKILVTAEEPSGGVSSTTSTWTAIGITGLVLTLLILASILGYLYFRFGKFGRAVAQVLSDDDVKDFRLGKPASETAPGEEEQLAIECLPYNSKFEVARENIIIDFNTELGSGNYGVVYMGYINRESDGTPIQVAVAMKTVRPNVGIEYFKALLSELKTLAYIGGHENIAKLVGAYSSNIKNRELYVGIEFCKTSLLQHLRKCADVFASEKCQNEYGNIDRPIASLDLIRWCGEIAAGMEYLSEKRIVHGDLAARNVLLSFEMRAKICDFGLARQLVDYTYIKRTKCNLPWKWMAIESLRQMHFSTMSDVWAYGVTCWEIFSLGEVPYAAMAWSWEFVNGLVAGNRLDKPKHATSEIFSIMLQCWFEKKERRPLFSDLKRFFQDQERQMAQSRTYVNTE